MNTKYPGYIQDPDNPRAWWSIRALRLIALEREENKNIEAAIRFAHEETPYDPEGDYISKKESYERKQAEEFIELDRKFTTPNRQEDSNNLEVLAPKKEERLVKPYDYISLHTRLGQEEEQKRIRDKEVIKEYFERRRRK